MSEIKNIPWHLLFLGLLQQELFDPLIKPRNIFWNLGKKHQLKVNLSRAVQRPMQLKSEKLWILTETFV